MLGSEELGEVARLKRLTPANAELDYLQELLLFSMYSEVGRELVFKGGTCLYKLQKLSRFSEDLDFTLCKHIDLEGVVEKVTRRLKFLGVFARVKEVRKHPKEINVSMVFRGPLYRGSRESLCFIPMNISLRERVVLDPERKTISSMYREIPSFDVFSMRVEEMMAEKVRAIFFREKPRDLYDMWFLLKNGVQLDPGLIRRKLKIHGMKFDSKKFIERVGTMDKLWRSDLKNLVIGELPEFEVVKNSVAESVEQL